MRMKLSEIASAVQGDLIGNDRMIESIGIDTRSLQPGDLYIAIKGENFDGHDFINAAKEAGAAALVVERRFETDLPEVIVPKNTRLALAEIAGAWRSRMPVKVVGVTGSNGKTTVKEMIAAILSVNDEVLFTRGNLNNDIGVPLTLLRLDENHRYAVIEMGANHRGEIAYTSRYAKPDVSIITNAGAAHIEGFGNLQGIAEAKGEIIESLSSDGTAILNRDDRFYDFWLRLADGRKSVSFGTNPIADVYAENIDFRVHDREFETAFDLVTALERMPMLLKLAGLHNVTNALGAAAAALQFGIGLEQIREGLAAIKPVTGRLQPIVGRHGNIIIDDSYNANPSSLKAALEVLVQCGGEPWVVLGSFGELGKESPALHREIGELCREMKIVRLLATGPDAGHCVDAFGEGATFFSTQEELIADLQRRLTGRETLLIKGSRARKMEKVAAALVENFRE